MRRREVIAGFAATAMLPLVARAQQSPKRPTIGVLGASSAGLAGPWVAAFVKRLGELGWSEGKNVTIEYRWAEARSERYSEIAAEFASRNVDVIVTWASAPVLAAKHATTTIPIVFAAQMDPVGAGVVASLARPGGNITGMSIQQTDTAGKRIELLREAAPRLARLAVMANAGAPGAVLEMREVVTTAHGLGLEAIPIEIKQADEIFAAIEFIEGSRRRALCLHRSADLQQPRQDQRHDAGPASADHLCRPGISRDGALMSYGPYWTELFRNAAEQVDKVLRGAKPADIPVEQPTKFYLVINAKAAKAIGLELSPSLLARADEVIE